MPSFETLQLRRDGATAHITLDRPERLNAVAMVGAAEVDRVAEQLANDPDIRLVTITGAGRAFSTGIDLKDLAAGSIDNSYFETWDRALRRFETMDKLVLCFIRGYAIGGGLQLALAADIRVATRGAKMGLPAIKEGLIPGLGTWRLARYIGLGRAKRMILLGEMIDAPEAQSIGMVDHLIEEAEADEAFQGLVERYTAVNSEGCRLSKRVLNDCFDRGFEDFFSFYLDLQERATASDDFREAMAAYRENRPPSWR
jgi:enoyl-CoA hydratase/carnithine racemase